jgi:hypothetical protein
LIIRRIYEDHQKRKRFHDIIINYGKEIIMSDDFIGALLKAKGVANDVIISLHILKSCNVEGLRKCTDISQIKLAKKLNVTLEALDGFPRKVRIYLSVLACSSIPMYM